ncbi:hypothetical protein [Deinococcus ruber]|uniref:Uncharacterized protein n=1 Tax=Deinococcus ruber TaxID=1848197 RepID=A0A918CAX1_9DEIO|nr:hypothetical protein [Deinococcus ruber]GGR13469.1 hypothetical protein GCM10008957_28030 [Deinococcus ruber]
MGYLSTNRRPGETPLAFFTRRFQQLSTGYRLLDVAVRPTLLNRTSELYLLIQEPDDTVWIYAGEFQVHPEPGFDLGYRDPVPERHGPSMVTPPERWLDRVTPLPPVTDLLALELAETRLALIQADAHHAATRGVVPDALLAQLTAAKQARLQADSHADSRAYRAAAAGQHTRLRALRIPGTRLRIPHLRLGGESVEEVTILSSKGRTIFATDALGRCFRLPTSVALSSFVVLPGAGASRPVR